MRNFQLCGNMNEMQMVSLNGDRFSADKLKVEQARCPEEVLISDDISATVVVCVLP